MQQNQQQAPQAQPQAQPMSQPMANGGATGFEAQETMQGDGGVAQPQETPETPPQATEAPLMEDGGVVNNDGLDWGLVFTFFNFRDE
jgi:hypothetical protein